MFWNLKFKKSWTIFCRLSISDILYHLTKPYCRSHDIIAELSLMYLSSTLLIVIPLWIPFSVYMSICLFTFFKILIEISGLLFISSVTFFLPHHSVDMVPHGLKFLLRFLNTRNIRRVFRQKAKARTHLAFEPDRQFYVNYLGVFFFQAIPPW